MRAISRSSAYSSSKYSSSGLLSALRAMAVSLRAGVRDARQVVIVLTTKDNKSAYWSTQLLPAG
jgi:hypothetical protein